MLIANIYLLIYNLIVVTRADGSRVSKAFIRVCLRFYLSVCLFVCTKTQKMIPKCFNLMYGMNLGWHSQTSCGEDFVIVVCNNNKMYGCRECGRDGIPPSTCNNSLRWLGGSVVERRSLTGELSLVCTGPAADG